MKPFVHHVREVDIRQKMDAFPTDRWKTEEEIKATPDELKRIWAAAEEKIRRERLAQPSS